MKNYAAHHSHYQITKKQNDTPNAKKEEHIYCQKEIGPSMIIKVNNNKKIAVRI